MKTFIPHELPKLKQINSNGSRVYETPTGKKYPSVTSITNFGTKSSLMEWRNRVGEEEANKISARASSRGTRIHQLCEDYLTGKSINPSMFDIEVWNQFKSEIHFIDNIHCMEDRLFSDILMVAGTVDLIAEYKGQLSIIDWKTSTRTKTIDDVNGYLMQCAAYAQAFGEMTDIWIDDLVVIIGTDDRNDPVVFTEKTDIWLKKFKQKRFDFYKYYKI